MRGYKNPELLWTPEGLRQTLDNSPPLIIDTRTTHEYVEGHIPGAVHFDLFGLNVRHTGPESLDSFLWMMEGLFGNRGVDHDVTVVVYDSQTGVRAARAFWFLEYFGHEDTHVLDGGFDAWEMSAHPVSQEPVKPKSVGFKARPVPERLATAESILKSLEDDLSIIIDTRTDGEHDGTEVRARRGGAVPGAIHIEWKHSIENGAYKNADELTALYEGNGISTDKEVSAYCQGGYRSAHTYLALRLLGYEKVRNYVSSWAEWGEREELPIEKP